MRARLTLWYTGVVALTLVVFSLLTYLYLVRAAQHRSDYSLADAANSVISTVDTEANDEGLSADDAAKEAAGAFHSSERVVAVYDERNEIVAVSALPQGLSHIDKWSSTSRPRQFSALLTAAGTSPAFATANLSGEDLRAVCKVFDVKRRPYKVLMIQSLREQTEGLAIARRAFYLINPLALLLASLGGYFLARKSLAPVISMANQAEAIGAENLEERLAELDPRNELGRLVQSFNSLLSRLQTSFQTQRRFMADASHELRTPVAIIRGESEVALSNKLRTADEYRESLAIVQDEGKRLARIVEDMFTLARADAGQYPIETSNMYLDETVAHCVRSVDSLATQHGLKLDYQTSAHELFFTGDEGLLERMTLNLLDNAIKYTPRGGSICLRLDRNGSSCRLAIADTGAGIPFELQPRIFERFFQANQTRSRDVERNGSAGLGLAIARWIAELHGGSLVLGESNSEGSTFVASLPLGPD